MKKHIIALLAISAIGLASCGTQKEAVADIPPPPPPVVNPALEWRKSSEFDYIMKQTFRYAAEQLQRKMGQIKEAPAVFIDVPFLLYDKNIMTQYFDQMGTLEDFRAAEAEGASKYSYNQDALDFLRMCQDVGAQIFLMADEKEILGTIENLAQQNIVVMPSMFENAPRYGKYARNISMMEMAESNRIALILTTSLGEATSLTGMGQAKNENMDEIMRVHGNKIILFPNPAFN
jgi:hypothetical protein